MPSVSKEDGEEHTGYKRMINLRERQHVGGQLCALCKMIVGVESQSELTAAANRDSSAVSLSKTTSIIYMMPSDAFTSVLDVLETLVRSEI